MRTTTNNTTPRTRTIRYELIYVCGRCGQALPYTWPQPEAGPHRLACPTCDTARRPVSRGRVCLRLVGLVGGLAAGLWGACLLLGW